MRLILICAQPHLTQFGPIWHTHPMTKPAKERHFIRSWRRHRGLTQEQLSERIGYDRSYLSKIEHFKKRYDELFLEAVAEALNCTAADLIMRDPSQPNSIWSIWDQIPPQEREHAAKVLETFAQKRTGTDN